MRVILPFRSSDYFNEVDDFIFYDDWSFFQSKVHWYNGAWYTNESLNFKATTLRALRVKPKGGVHQTWGIYSCYTTMGLHHLSYKTNGVHPIDLLAHIRYNISWRFGRALVVDGETLYVGYLSEAKCKQFITEYVDSKQYKEFVECTAPYH